MATLLCAGAALAASDGTGSPQGRYTAPNGIVSLDFQADGKVRLDGGGGDALLPYSVSGQSLTIQAPRGPRTLTIVNEDTLLLTDGSNMRLLRDRSFACKDEDGEVGTMILDHAGRVLLRAPAGTPQASAAPEPLGTYTEEGGSIAVQQSEGTNTFTREGRDLRAGKLICKRL
ncbi:hypothetical protein IAI18_22550 [Acetobacteraceae bacterium H6797]|nr:hypothetical protein [Acetobacteraceae bacterium H6797]